MTTKVTVPDLAGKFATTGTKTTIPPAVATAFDASVDAALQTGLQQRRRLAEHHDRADPGAAAAELDDHARARRRRQDGKGLYRFTYHEPAAAAGAKTAAPRAADPRRVARQGHGPARDEGAAAGEGGRERRRTRSPRRSRSTRSRTPTRAPSSTRSGPPSTRSPTRSSRSSTGSSSPAPARRRATRRRAATTTRRRTP